MGAELMRRFEPFLSVYRPPPMRDLLYRMEQRRTDADVRFALFLDLVLFVWLVVL